MARNANKNLCQTLIFGNPASRAVENELDLFETNRLLKICFVSDAFRREVAVSRAPTW